MKAKKTESRSKLAKPPKAIKWKSSEVYHLRRNLAHVQSKLDRIHVLGPRLAVEAPEMQVGDLISRLRQRKKELIKKISEENEKTLRKPRSGGSFKQGGSAGREFWLPPPDLWDLWLQYRMDSLAGKGPFPPSAWSSGFVEAQYWREVAYEKLKVKNKLDPSYSAGFGLERDHFYFHGRLSDDTPFFGGDDPNEASWGSELIYTFPPPEADAILHVSFSISVGCNFTDAADDGGLLVHSVVINHTDPDGNWPNYPTGIYAEVERDQVVFLHVNATHFYYSSGPPGMFDLTFEAKRGREPAIFILFVTHLRAQDGLVETDGRWYVPAQMKYHYIRT
jgi:hypothetical protein